MTYRRHFRNRMAEELERLYKLDQQNPGGSVHNNTQVANPVDGGQRGENTFKVLLWDFAERLDRNHLRINQKGKDFVEGKIKVRRTVVEEGSQRLSYDEDSPLITFDEALNDTGRGQ